MGFDTLVALTQKIVTAALPLSLFHDSLSPSSAACEALCIDEGVVVDGKGKRRRKHVKGKHLKRHRKKQEGSLEGTMMTAMMINAMMTPNRSNQKGWKSRDGWVETFGSSSGDCNGWPDRIETTSNSLRLYYGERERSVSLLRDRPFKIAKSGLIQFFTFENGWIVRRIGRPMSNGGMEFISIRHKSTDFNINSWSDVEPFLYEAWPTDSVMRLTFHPNGRLDGAEDWRNERWTSGWCGGKHEEEATKIRRFQGLPSPSYATSCGRRWSDSISWNGASRREWSTNRSSSEWF